MTTPVKHDPFAAITPHLPARYAPGHELEAYPYPAEEPPSTDTWYPVIYYPAGGVEAGEGPIWLVEPFPAARADGADGQEPIEKAGVAVLCRDAAPRPLGDDLDGDWVIPSNSLAADCAYGVYVRDQRELMAAWCEAYAIATALNNGTADRLGVSLEDVEVLLAAERGALVGDSRFAGTGNELRWTPVDTTGDRVEPRRVPRDQAGRLRNSADPMLEPAVVTENPADADSSGHVETAYVVTRRARAALEVIRQQYDGPRRCRTCGCTDERGCPPPTGTAGGMYCAWAHPDLCTACA
jgi:hypothetical protein